MDEEREVRRLQVQDDHLREALLREAAKLHDVKAEVQRLKAERSEDLARAIDDQPTVTPAEKPEAAGSPGPRVLRAEAAQDQAAAQEGSLAEAVMERPSPSELRSEATSPATVVAAEPEAVAEAQQQRPTELSGGGLVAPAGLPVVGAGAAQEEAAVGSSLTTAEARAEAELATAAAYARPPPTAALASTP